MVMRCMLCRITKLIFIFPDEAFLRKALSFVKKEAQQGIEEINKWHEGISKNRIFNPQTPRANSYGI